MTSPQKRLSILRANRERMSNRQHRKEVTDAIRQALAEKLADRLKADLDKIDADQAKVSDSKSLLQQAGLDTDGLRQLLNAHPEYIVEIASQTYTSERDADGFPVNMSEGLRAELKRLGLDPRKLQPQPGDVDADGFPSYLPPHMKTVLKAAGLDPHKLREEIEAGEGKFAPVPPEGVTGIGPDGFPTNMPDEIKAALRRSGVDPHKVNAMVLEQLNDPKRFKASNRVKMIQEMLAAGIGDTVPPYKKRMNFEEFLAAARNAREQGATGMPPELDAGLRAQLAAMGAVGMTAGAVALPQDLAPEFIAALEDMGQHEAAQTGMVDMGPLIAAATHPKDCGCPPCRIRRIVEICIERDPTSTMGAFIPDGPKPVH